MACEFCETIITGKRNANGHAHLAVEGKPKKHKNTGQANIHITQYKCSKCGTRWECESDKNDDHAGWKRL